MASSSSTPSSTITLPKKYQVFLSFRGPDTRAGFTSHLYDALSGKCMVTFIDYKLVRGDEISTALLKSIEESMIAVVIFSKDYASSTWCLRELAEIMKREKLRELTVIPVFYNVVPSDVRYQTGPFKDSFAKHENDSPEEVLEWREAFTEASHRAGCESAKTRSEAELVRDIVEGVQNKLMGEIENISPPLYDLGLIGIKNRIKPVLSLLSLGRMDDVQIIGIWGMGGIGKTTLTEVVFNQISGLFDGSCFVAKVGERLENGETNGLQLEVLSKVLHEENLQLATPTILNPFIQQRLSQRKLLIVFDDVNNFLRLDGFVKGLRFGLGSRIIITSRDKQVLHNFKVPDSNIYKVKGLDFDEALKLFSNYAFNQNHPTEDFWALSERMVYYANGNPLALRVLGSALLGMSKQEWESAVDDLQGIGDSDIFNVLKISYDRLNDKEKNLFLDIACFFNGRSQDYITKLLDCKYSLRVLINKSLITIRSQIDMHDLLEEMGREIVRRESPKNPGKRSRLWKPNDVIWTLKNNNGAEEVEGIYLNMGELKDGHLNLSCRVFDKMTNLRLLLFSCYYNVLESNKVHLSDGRLNSLPDELIILQWPKYPLRALPSNFSPEKLVKLDLSNSNIEQLWEGTKHAPKLKWLILIYCTDLIKIPNLTDFLSLEEVDLTGCNSLVEFPSSAQQLTKLRYLSLGGCSNVTKFPLTSASIERLNLRETAIEEVPSSIQSLTNLTKIDLTSCRRLKHISASIFKLKSVRSLDLDDCSELETFPEISETMEILNSLELSGTAITDLHSSIEYLNGFHRLTLRNCKNLEMLPSSICDLTSLEDLDLSYCSKLDRLPENLGNLKSLKHLIVEGSAVGQLPSSIRYLENLESLNCSECKGLTKLPPLSGLRSLSFLILKCNITEIPKDIGCLSSLEWLDLCGNMFESLPKSIKQLSKLEYLSVRDCNMLRSLTELPVALRKLDASNCKQLCQALPDASEFKHLSKLETLLLSDCNMLRSLTELPVALEELDAINCTKLDKLPENLGNLKSLKKLTVRGSAVCQLPSSIRYLENLESLNCSECRGLTKLPPLSGLRSLSRLDLKKCNLTEIPEDIGCLSSLEWLDLRGNMFESLPKSIKHFSKLKTLILRDCNKLRSLTELPVALRKLDAINCKQLCQALPDASEFKRCITYKYHRPRWDLLWDNVKFLFINCFNLDQKAVSNVFEESVKGSEEPPTRFSIYLPGNKIPEWFTYQSPGSSINIRVLRQDLVNRKFMGFAICAVLGIEEFHKGHDFHGVQVYCHFDTCNLSFPLSHKEPDFIINSNHIFLGYFSFSEFLSSSQNLEMRIANDSDYVDSPFEFKYRLGVKYCAVHPTYAEPIEIIGATIEDIGVTSLKRSGRSNDNE